MGRTERRKQAKRIQRRHPGVTFKNALKTATAMEIVSMKSNLQAGDKVKIRVDHIKESVNYKNYSERYREFIEAHKDDVFTLEEVDDKRLQNIFQFVEDENDPKWMFCGIDLQKVEEPKEEHAEETEDE